MNRKQKVAVALVVAIGLVGALWYLAQRGGWVNGADTSADKQSSDHVLASSTTDRGSGIAPPRFVARRPAAPGTPAPIFGPMPAINTPMRLAYPQLKAQADAGDPVAQCRLALDLLRCKRFPELVQSSKTAEERYKKLGPKGPQAWALLQETLATETALCQDFTPDPADQPWRLMVESGINGNHAAALSFVINPPLNRERPVGDLDGWEAYRDYAPQFLQQAIRSGDSRGYQAAMWVGSWDRTGANIGPRDPVDLAAYELAMMPMAEPTYAAFLQKQVQSLNLNEAQLAEAQTKAAPLAAALKPAPDGQLITGNNIIGYGRWTAGAECEH